jgi:hypothetical protein
MRTYHAPVAQWIEQVPAKNEAVSSILTGRKLVLTSD